MDLQNYWWTVVVVPMRMSMSRYYFWFYLVGYFRHSLLFSFWWLPFQLPHLLLPFHRGRCRPQTISCHLQLAASPHACICRPHLFVLVHQQARGPPPPVFLAEILLFLVRLSLCGNINILAETLTCGVRSIFEHSHQTSLLVIYFVSFNNIY